jgi:nitroreductase
VAAVLEAMVSLTAHFHEAPVLSVCCLVGDVAAALGLANMAGTSISPAVQNMLLAAWGLGLGATLTTRPLLFEKEVNAVLGLPDTVETFASIPIGYPSGKFGPVSRLPVEAVTFQDRWGQQPGK